MRSLIIAFTLTVSGSAFAGISGFELPWYNSDAGAVYKSADHPGTVFVMEAHQNFCSACNENAPNVDELAVQYAGNHKVQVLDLSLDSNDREIRSWIARHQPNHPVVKDVNKAIWAQINESYIPTAVVVDCDGAIVWKSVGVWDPATKAGLRASIDAAVAACD